MEKIKLPTKADVERESLDNLFDKVKKNIIRAEDQENYTEVLNKLLAEGNSLYDISASLLKMVNESSNKTKIKDLDRVDYGKKFEMSKKSDSSKRKSKDKGMKKIKGPKIFINKGKRDDLDSRDIIKFLGKYTNLTPSDIGRINIMPNFSFVEIPKDMIKDAIRDIDGKNFKGKSIKAEYSEK